MVDEGFLTEDQLLDALAEQSRSGTPLGKVLVDLGFVSPGAVANALAEQHGGLLRTEYGTSAGLREMAGRAPIRTEAPQPTLPMPAAPAQPEPQAPAPSARLRSSARRPGRRRRRTKLPLPFQFRLPFPLRLPFPWNRRRRSGRAAARAGRCTRARAGRRAGTRARARAGCGAAAGPCCRCSADARIQELESKLHAVLTERNSLAQSFNELQARLSDAAQAREAGVNAEVQERVGALESQLQAAAANREELERAQQQAAARIAELEGHLAETAEDRQRLDGELETLRTAAAGRDDALGRVTALEAELDGLRTRGNEDSSAELQELAEQRRAAQERAEALESDLAQLREQLETALRSAAAEKESESARAAELEAELAALREQSSGQDDAVAQVSGLNEALQALTVERDAALERAACPGARGRVAPRRSCAMPRLTSPATARRPTCRSCAVSSRRASGASPRASARSRR